MQFDFGQNWKEFSKKALDNNKIKEAEKDFKGLVSGIDIKGKSFLDIGFGQGLSFLTSLKLGANSYGLDINPKCLDVLLENSKFYSNLNLNKDKIIIGSILDDQTINEIKSRNENYDIVHSWGVLHHTGGMYKAIENAASLVSPNGYLIIAIYNKHWSSKIWLFLKWLYCKSPNLIQKLFTIILYPIILVAKYLVTFKNPFKQERGMNFYYDVIDWIGGYPYEYASKDEIKTYLKYRGFELKKYNDAIVPTGCNEFIFQKNN